MTVIQVVRRCVDDVGKVEVAGGGGGAGTCTAVCDDAQVRHDDGAAALGQVSDRNRSAFPGRAGSWRLFQRPGRLASRPEPRQTAAGVALPLRRSCGYLRIGRRHNQGYPNRSSGSPRRAGALFPPLRAPPPRRRLRSLRSLRMGRATPSMLSPSQSSRRPGKSPTCFWTRTCSLPVAGRYCKFNR